MCRAVKISSRVVLRVLAVRLKGLKGRARCNARPENDGLGNTKGLEFDGLENDRQTRNRILSVIFQSVIIQPRYSWRLCPSFSGRAFAVAAKVDGTVRQ